MMEDEFLDPESSGWGHGDEFGFKQLVLMHVSRIIKFGSVELRGGYETNKAVKLGSGIQGYMKVYIPDSREMLSNAIDMLYLIMHNKFDDKIKKEIEEINKLKYKTKDEKVVVKKQLLQSLLDFLDRLNYLSMGDTTE